MVLRKVAALIIAVGLPLSTSASASECLQFCAAAGVAKDSHSHHYRPPASRLTAHQHGHVHQQAASAASPIRSAVMVQGAQCAQQAYGSDLAVASKFRLLKDTSAALEFQPQSESVSFASEARRQRPQPPPSRSFDPALISLRI